MFILDCLINCNLQTGFSALLPYYDGLANTKICTICSNLLDGWSLEAFPTVPQATSLKPFCVFHHLWCNSPYKPPFWFDNFSYFLPISPLQNKAFTSFCSFRKPHKFFFFLSRLYQLLVDCWWLYNLVQVVCPWMNIRKNGNLYKLSIINICHCTVTSCMTVFISCFSSN